MKPIYVRIRRKQQTFCVFCQPQQHTPDFLKDQIKEILAQFDTAEDREMRLMDTAGEEVTDLKTLKNEQELHVVFRLTDDEFEPVDIPNVDMAE